MKNIFIRIILAILGFIFVYLFGSFYNISFNLNDWNEQSRGLVSMIGGIVFLGLLTFPNYNFEDC